MSPRIPTTRRRLDRRGFLKAAGAGAFGLSALSLTACSSSGADSNAPLTEVRYAMIGDGKAEPATILRNNLGGFDIGADLGVPVEWPSGFPASLPVMEAIKAGSVDFSFATATAVIYAIGGGVPIVPLVSYPLPTNEVDILVPQGSDIKSAANLKGRKVADHRGTTGTYSLVKYLETAGLTLDDIEYVNLPAADAEAAFAEGKVDAWISWQPTIELARRKHNAVALADVKTYDYAFFVASENFAFGHPDVAAELVRNVRDAQRWIEANPEVAVGQFAELGGFGDSTLEEQVYLDLVKARRLSYSGAGEFTAVDAAAISGTQDLADNFHRLGVYPEQVDVTTWLQDSRFDSIKSTVNTALAN
ncbi:NrtA/SsuA/CpmA family ABC transporter substrate-binding protein [Rhodococcus globerulus]|uniref:NrtA/SsuA/CpmA family ABC transporter substrate-binding protein n=1 Tax=Rhodococcus globerulus TaxID=33008 RepID=A0ABU4C4B0_RHOGO|nr:NrtA/SsuA/CpmA family ABC transporter substrate-binding protein [Rhodococcus globerulus]MDV6271218.1 NrtA/SsuA/CpmA family ABC transporter substrate-binding protein [Rhodococcus globerulus]